MKIVFMGTADFAVPTLKSIHESIQHQVLAVVTTPDKMGGRGRKQILSSSVKEYALQANIPVLQPEKLKDDSFVEELSRLEADLFVVVAFRMLPEKVWSMPSKGTINLHGSLLPKYRGAAPINWAIINGEQETGVTTFMIDKEIDTGLILMQKSEPIYPDDNFGTLYNRLQYVGADLMLETLESIESKEAHPIPQDNAHATHAPKIFKETCLIDFDRSRREIHNFIRGLSPTPGAWMIWNAQEVKIYQAEITNEEVSNNINPGNLWLKGKNELMLQCKDGPLRLLEAQIQGKKKMTALEIINGHRHLLQ